MAAEKLSLGRREFGSTTAALLASQVILSQPSVAAEATIKDIEKYGKAAKVSFPLLACYHRHVKR